MNDMRARVGSFLMEVINPVNPTLDTVDDLMGTTQDMSRVE